jgi:hypothetical protein
MQHNNRHREGRRYLYNAFGSRRATLPYAPAQEAEIGRFLRKLLTDPEGFATHSKWRVSLLYLSISTRSNG